jgi:hypothetical protein
MFKSHLLIDLSDKKQADQVIGSACEYNGGLLTAKCRKHNDSSLDMFCVD